MRTAVIAAITVTILAASATYGADSRQSTTSGSFLRYRANSAQELSYAVKRNPATATRYARHFGTTSYGVANYFESKLRLVRLKKATTTPVYYYNSSGKVTRGRRVMPAGTLVFATGSGEPVLDWRCGNPLRASLPVRRAIKSAGKSTTTAKAKGAAGSVTASASAGTAEAVKVAADPPDPDKIVEKVLSAPPAELAATATAAAAVTAPAVALAEAPLATAPFLPAAGSALPPIVEVAAVPSVGAVGAMPVIAAASHGFSWLSSLAALGGAVGIANRNRGTSTPAPPDSVPEPSSLLTLTAGMATACTAALRKRKRLLT